MRLPDKREVGSSTLPRPINSKELSRIGHKPIRDFVFGTLLRRLPRRKRENSLQTKANRRLPIRTGSIPGRQYHLPPVSPTLTNGSEAHYILPTGIDEAFADPTPSVIAVTKIFQVTKP